MHNFSVANLELLKWTSKPWPLAQGNNLHGGIYDLIEDLKVYHAIYLHHFDDQSDEYEIACSSIATETSKRMKTQKKYDQFGMNLWW